MKKITLLILALFLSYSGFSQFPTPGTESFESTSGADLPGSTTPTPWTLGTGIVSNQWAVFDNGVGLNQRWTINNGTVVAPTPPLVYSGVNAAYINRENIGQGNTSEDYLATPLITVPTNGQLRFFNRSFTLGNQGTIYQIKINTTPGTQTNLANYTVLAEFTEDQLTLDPQGVQNAFNIYTEKIIDFPASTIGNQVYIAFVMKYTQTTTGINGDRWLLDNVRISQKCLNPSGLTATGVLYNQATLSWANPSGATSWEIEILPVAATATGVGTIYNGGLPYIATGLTPNTPYKYYVRALCGDGINSEWVGPITFTTPIAPPICGGNYLDAGLVAGNYSNNTDSTITICPVTPGDVVTVTFTSFNTEINADGMYVFNGNTTAATQIASTNPAGTVPGGLAGSYWGTTIPGPFTSSSPDGCLTFRFRSGAANVASGWAANITCGLPPSCSVPISVTRSAITTTSVTLGWTNTNAATEWHVLAVPCGSPTPNATTTGWVTATTNPYILGGLNADTCYDFYVRAVCSSTDFSNWTSSVSATTLILPPACGGTFSDPGGSSVNYANNLNSIVTICPINPGDVVTVTFTSFNTQATADGLYIFNGNSITSPLISSGNPAGTVPGGLAGAYWGTSNPGSFTSTSTDGCLTFRFRSGASVNAAGWTSNVTCAPPPTCPKPQSIVTTAITYNSVNLAWTETGSATAWQVLAVPCGSPFPNASATGWVSATTNPFVLSGLTSETCYDIYVRSECSASDISTWAGPRSITTLIAPPLCGGPFVDNGGAIANYLNNSDVTWTVCPTIPGEQVTVTFTTFNTEANWDGLYVFDGNTIGAPQIASTNGIGNVPGGLAGSFWGTTIPGPFTSSSPDGCLTFRFRSDGVTNNPGWNANVTCTPQPTCPRPYLVTVTGATETSAVIGWTEVGTATSWQVIVLPVGDPAPNATTTGWISTTTNPFIYTPLSSGTQYKAYVRSICSTTDSSLWSNGAIFNTLISNDECLTAIQAPVNPNTICTLVAGGTVIGATASSQPNTCGGNDDDDVWYKFTATSTSHSISLLNITGSTTDLFHVLYSGTCGALTQIYCSDPETSLATGLVVGQTYYIRIYTFTATPNQTSVFNLCIGTVPPPISTSEGVYSNLQLVEDVLLNSTCAAVGNITSSTGTNFSSTNGIGYFNKNGSDFPFEEGVVLTTGSIVNVPGPNDTTLGEGGFGWPGDADLEAIILAATGAAMNSQNATKLEFDFTPLSDQISFRFIFASEEYGTFQCAYSDAFAFLLTDVTAGVTPVTTNLALIPGTNTPISVVTIRNQLYNNGCTSVNPEYFAAFYGVGGLGNFTAPIDYNGMTVPMTAAATVIPGHQYHIKMVVADRSDTAYDSAVFIEGGSFNIGNVELGNDFLVQNGTALCPGDDFIIQSGLNPANYNFIWSNGTTVLEGETGPNLTVNQEGTYTVTANYIGTTCVATDSLTVEYYDSFVTQSPINLVDCNNLTFSEFNLNLNNSVVLGALDATLYTVSYHNSIENAEDNTNTLPTLYTNTTPSLQTIYVRIENNESGCFVVYPFNLVVQDLTPQFTISSDFSICQGTTGTITVTPINFNSSNVTYSWTLDGNVLSDTGASINVTLAGTYSVVINNSGCTATGTTVVTVTPFSVPDAPSNVTECNSYTLPTLAVGDYYTGSNASGSMLTAGTIITTTQTLYVYAQSNTTPNCTSENSFVVTITPLTTPTFNSIAAICLNDVAPTLPTTSLNGYTGSWSNSVDTSIVGTTTYTFTPDAGQCANTATISVTVVAPTVASFTQISPICQGGTAPSLPLTSNNSVTGTWNPTTVNVNTPGTVLYTFTANSGQCATGTTMSITIHPTPVVAPINSVVECVSYTLPILSNGNYYTQSGGNGTQLSAGTVITSSQTIWVYDQSGTTPNCTDEESFSVTINPAPQFSIIGGCEGPVYVLEVISDTFSVDSAVYEWTNSAGLVVGTNSSTLNVTTAGNYTCKVTVSGCSDTYQFNANSITCLIPKGISPNGDGLNDTFDLSGFNVKELSIFNRYGSKVYSKTNYTNEWYGQSKNDQELPDGTYYYMIERNDSSEAKTGWIYINRENK